MKKLVKQLDVSVQSSDKAVSVFLDTELKLGSEQESLAALIEKINVEKAKLTSIENQAIAQFESNKSVLSQLNKILRGE